MEAEDSSAHQAKPCGVHAFHWHSHLQHRPQELTLLEHPSCLLRVSSVNTIVHLATCKYCSVFPISVVLEHRVDIQSFRLAQPPCEQRRLKVFSKTHDPNYDSWIDDLSSILNHYHVPLPTENETLTLRLSSFSNVVVTNMVILAPHDSPNTDGVDPGICSFIYSFFVAHAQRKVLDLPALIHLPNPA